MPQSQRNRSENLVRMPTGNQLVEVTDSDIARRAYELFEARGSEHGHDLDDWLRAKREMRERIQSTAA